MYNNKKVLCIIPARKGSKRLKNKNVKLFAGKPLVTYTIQAAKRSKYIDRIIVSTDSPKLYAIALKLEVEAVYRPANLAQDDSLIMTELMRLMLRADNDCGILVLLQPTSPLRTVGDIDNCVRLSIEKSSCVVSVYKPKYTAILENKNLKDIPDVYSVNGAIYVADIDYLLEYKTFFTNTIFYQMPLHNSIDIDEYEDFKLAELIFKNMKRKCL